MSIWRPPAQIRAKALGLHWRGKRLLAAEVRDDTGRVKGVRPLGGSIEFGEPARDALLREFREELGIDASIDGAPFFMENIYVHEGAPGHELVILFAVTFPAGAFEGEERITFREDNGDTVVARWFDPAELDVPGAPELYPTGLKARLHNSR